MDDEYYEADDDIWDYDEPVPAVTYADAVQQLTALASLRSDVRIEWSGNRGPRGDARLVFLKENGDAILRTRFRSATDLPGARRLVEQVHPIPEHRALWVKSEDVIEAWLAGPRDDIILALSRQLRPKLKTRANLHEHPVVQDVFGLLNSTGLLNVDDKRPHGRGARTLRIAGACDSLLVAYAGSRRRELPGIALKLGGFSPADASEAKDALESYGSSYLHMLASNLDLPVRLWSPAYKQVPSARTNSRSRIRFPSRRHDLIPTELYGAANTPGRDALERYLKYYQVLEYYYLRAATSYSASIGKSGTQGVVPSRKQLSIEPGQIEALLRIAMQPRQLEGFLRGSNILAVASDSRVIADVRTLERDPNGQPKPGFDYRDDVAMRIYGIRCRIVHAKEPGRGGKRTGRPLLPFSREARSLQSDIQLVRFVAERVMDHWATPLP
ncbi:hypothetical protein O7605_30030 [Verrucosispora sp. WMMA2121]|uniref:hypothetical protein n=1 Tax=Verrucosispora sp. WMMA2121 TaxID=3015164 RepID=UPI0022B6FCF9|nr:hypothetical protein [Verrucosispora sp. WMMA2121]MCZ7423755.1 hypothetical protein [Verrucosispora sp. WMMA2121]